MLKFGFKIHAVILMMLLSLGYLVPAHITFAFFSDSASSFTNSFRVGILSNMIQEGNWIRDGEEINAVSSLESGDVISRKVVRANSGTMDFQYKMNVDSTKNDLCDFLQIQAVRNGEEKYRGSLLDLNLDESIILGVAEPEEWIFTVTLTEPAGLGGQCSFAIIFQSWQLGFNWGEGFSHTSRVENILEIEGSATDVEKQVDDSSEEQIEFNLEEIGGNLEGVESGEDSELLETAESEDSSIKNNEESLNDNQNNSLEEDNQSGDSEEESESSEDNSDGDEPEDSSEKDQNGLEESTESSDSEEEPESSEDNSDENKPEDSGEENNNNLEEEPGLSEDNSDEDEPEDSGEENNNNPGESVESVDSEEESELSEDNSDEDEPEEDQHNLEESVESSDSEESESSEGESEENAEGEFSDDDSENPDEMVDSPEENVNPDLDSGDSDQLTELEEGGVDLPGKTQSISEPESTEKVGLENQENNSNNQNEGV